MSMRLSRLCAKFISWGEKSLKKNTLFVYRHYFRKFLEHRGDVPVSKLVPADLSAWAETWHQAQALKRLFNWAVLDARLVEENPFARVKQPPKGQRQRVMTRGEMAALLRFSRPDIRRLLLAMRETFARPGELRAAQWEDLRPNENAAELLNALRDGRACIMLRDYKSRRARKDANAPRVIVLSPRVGRLIRRLAIHQVELRGPIFRTQAGRPWTANALRCRFRRARVYLQLLPDPHGERIVPYTFRHTGGTACAAAGIRDRLLAEILGHTETQTTARYQHLCTDHLRTALRCVWSKPRRSNGESGPPR